jgi:multidrug efflux system outer membrane protein
MLKERYATVTPSINHKTRGYPLLYLILCAAVFFLATGCALKSPPWREEIQQQALANIDLPAEWAAGSYPGIPADNWLALFEDEQLSALVAEAVTHNPDLRISATRVEQAAEYVNLAKAALLPAVNLLGTGGIKGGGGDMSSALQGVSLGVSWELDLWGLLRYGRNAAEETSRSAQADFQFARQSIAAATAKSWFTASETWLQQQIASDMEESARQLLTLAEQRHKVGVGSEQDIAVAQASLGTYRDNVAQIRLAHQQTLRALELLIGRYPATELKARQDLTKLPGQVPVGIPLEMLERRPDLIAAERRIAAAFNRVGEAKAARLPRIALNASVGAFTSEVLQLSNNFQNPTSGAGARLLAPIYQGGALLTQVEIRTLEQKEAIAQYAAIALRALGDVENSLAAGQNLAERDLILQRYVIDNQRALKLVEASYRTGKTDLRSVQQQQLSLQAARLSLLRVQSEQLSQRVNLHLALGGSFTAEL